MLDSWFYRFEKGLTTACQEATAVPWRSPVTSVGDLQKLNILWPHRLLLMIPRVPGWVIPRSFSITHITVQKNQINQCWCLLLTSMWQEILTDQGHRFRMFVLGFREIWYFTIPYNLDCAELAYHGNTGILETTDIFIYSVSQHKEISNNCRAWLACRNWGHLFLLKQTELSEKYPKVIMNFTN